MTEIEYVTIDDIKYGIIREVSVGRTTFVYLSNLDNPDDCMVRKCTKDEPNSLYPLSDTELERALELFA